MWASETWFTIKLKKKRNLCGALMCRKKHKKMLKQYLISSRVSEWWWERDYTKNLMKAPHTGSSNLLDAWVYFQTHWQRFFFRKKFLFFSLTVLCGWEFDVFSCERVSERETFLWYIEPFTFIYICVHITAKSAAGCYCCCCCSSAEKEIELHPPLIFLIIIIVAVISSIRQFLLSFASIKNQAQK